MGDLTLCMLNASAETTSRSFPHDRLATIDPGQGGRRKPYEMP